MGAKSWVMNNRATAKGAKTKTNDALRRALGMQSFREGRCGVSSNLGMAVLASLRSRHLDDLTWPAFEHHKTILT